MGLTRFLQSRLPSLSARTSTNIRRKRHVINVAKTEKIIFRLRDTLRGVVASEIKHRVYFIIRNLRRNLLCASGVTDEKRFYIKPCGVLNISACRVSSTKMMTAENSAIRNAKLRHKLFFVIVCNNSNMHKGSPLTVKYDKDGDTRVCIVRYYSTIKRVCQSPTRKIFMRTRERKR